MGLWNKVIQRSLTGTPRLEDKPINVHVLEQIREYIDTSGNNLTNEDYKCSYHINNRKVIFRIYGYAFSIIIPEGQDNLPYIMQSLSHTIGSHLLNLPFKSKQRLELLHRNIEFNKEKWRKTKSMYTKDEMFLHIEYETKPWDFGIKE